MHHFDPSVEIQDYLVFGEYGDVNPSITDSSTYTFLNPDTMKELFEQEIEGCFLYSRHWNPTNKYLADALAKLEDSEAAIVTGSGMSAIACSVLQLCSCGDEIVSSRTIYGGTYAFFKNFLPRHGIKVKFVNTQDLDAVEEAITDKTKIIYTESVSNPLLEIADLPKLGKIADAHNIKLMVDIINKNNDISLRTVNWFGTKHLSSMDSRERITSDGKVEKFDPLISYSTRLGKYGKKGFDPFRRGPAFEWQYDTNDPEKVIITTLCQLQFFQWIFEYELMDYIIGNLKKIKDMMKKSERKKKVTKSNKKEYVDKKDDVKKEKIRLKAKRSDTQYETKLVISIG